MILFIAPGLAFPTEDGGPAPAGSSRGIAPACGGAVPARCHGGRLSGFGCSETGAMGGRGSARWLGQRAARRGVMRPRRAGAAGLG